MFGAVQKRKDDLGTLFYAARDYGRVSLITMDDGTYHCRIEFNSIRHTSLEAKSDYNHATPEEAISKALEVAQTIVTSLKQSLQSLPKSV